MDTLMRREKDPPINLGLSFDTIHIIFNTFESYWSSNYFRYVLKLLFIWTLSNIFFKLVWNYILKIRLLYKLDSNFKMWFLNLY